MHLMCYRNICNYNHQLPIFTIFIYLLVLINEKKIVKTHHSGLQCNRRRDNCRTWKVGLNLIHIWWRLCPTPSPTFICFIFFWITTNWTRNWSFTFFKAIMNIGCFPFAIDPSMSFYPNFIRIKSGLMVFQLYPDFVQI